MGQPARIAQVTTRTASRALVPVAAVTLIVLVAIYATAWTPAHTWHSFLAKPDPWVAGGTVLLAAATFLLALTTSRATRASLEELEIARQEVELSRRSLQTNTKPLLIEAARGVDLGVDDDGLPLDRAAPSISAGAGGGPDDVMGYVEVKVPVENVGAGLALVERSALTGLLPGVNLIQSVSQSAIPAGQRATFTFSGEIDPGEAYIGDDRRSQHEFYLDVWYTDAAGEQRTRTRLMIEGRLRSLRATRVRVYDGDAAEPYIDVKREILTIREREAATEPDDA